MNRSWPSTGTRALVFAALTAGLLFSIPACNRSELSSGKGFLDVEPESVDFGALNVGDLVALDLTLTNTGTAALAIQEVQLTGDSAFAIQSLDGAEYTADSLPIGLTAPGAGVSQRVLAIGFSPTEQIEYAGELVLTTNAKDTPEVRVALSGSGNVADIDVRPERLDFGGVGLNSSASLSLTVANEGQAPLRVPAAELGLESGDPESPFIWLGRDLELGHGEEDSFEVIYAPKQVQLDAQGQVIPDQDVLLVASNDPDEDPVRVELTGYVSDNLPPVTAVKISQVTKLDGSPLDDVCTAAPVDTIRFEGRALDPEGGTIQGANLRWAIEQKPNGSTRDMQIPALEQDRFTPTFKADLSGEYVVCLAASDPQGNLGSYDPAEACDCETANAAEDYSCPCIRFAAFPREDIRIELTWDILGPDLDLHLVAPDGEYCSPTRECRYNIMNPDDPDWTRTACVDAGAITTCRTPNCDPVAAGCQEFQECYDDGSGPQCFWQTCSGTDCYWNARRPDWGAPGDTSDDPVLAIDCTGQCRAENINLNHPVPGIYTVMVNYYEFRGNTTATVRIYFKGDVVPTAEFQTQMTEDCDAWTVALIDWIDHDNHPVTEIQNSHTLRCCD